MIRRCAWVEVLWLWGLTAAASELDVVTAQLAQESIVTGQFTQQRRVASLPFPLVSSGEFVLQREQGLYWHVLTPAESELRIRDGQVQERIGGEASTWAAPPLGEQGNRMTARLLTDLLSGRFASLDGLFALTADTSDDGWRVRLVPRSEASAAYLHAISVSGGAHVDRVVLDHGAGETTTIRLDTAPARELTPRERDILGPP